MVRITKCYPRGGATTPDILIYTNGLKQHKQVTQERGRQSIGHWLCYMVTNQPSGNDAPIFSPTSKMCLQLCHGYISHC